MRGVVLIGAVGVVAAACSEPRLPPLVTRVDSVGVELVTTTPVDQGRAPIWHLSRRPVLELGELDGPEELTFGNVRAVGRLADGRIYIGDEEAHVVRVFSETGDYEGFFGGEGEGPGELQWFLTVKPYRGDSIFVHDYSLQSISVFGPDLQFGRRFRNPLLRGNYWITDALPDGRFLAISPGRSFFPGETGFFADSSHIVVVGPAGEVADTVGRYRANVEHLDSEGRPEPSFLQPRGGAFLADDHLVWLDGERVELVVATLDGRPIRVARKVEARTPVTADLWEEFRGIYLEMSGQNPEAPQERIRRALDEGHYPEFLPALSPELHVDPLGYLWVARYHFPGQVATDWEVFDSTGAWVGRVGTPEGFQVHQIEEDEVFGVARDEFDVPYLHVYRLRRE